MDADIVCRIHEYLVDYFVESEDPISPPGVKSVGLLESACARPLFTAGGREMFDTDFLKASALFHGIISNHCFHNGNKRTGLLSTLYYLGECNYWLERCGDSEIFEFTRQVAAHELCDNRDEEIDMIAQWFEKNSRKVQKGNKEMSFLELRSVLSDFGYELIEQGTMATIQKDGEVVEQILKRGTQGLSKYDSVYIAELRKRLNLTVSYGVDSARFYGQKGLVSELNDHMQLRCEVFRWLAKI